MGETQSRPLETTTSRKSSAFSSVLQSLQANSTTATTTTRCDAPASPPPPPLPSSSSSSDAPPPPPPTPGDKTNTDSIEAASAAATAFANPGPYEQASADSGKRLVMVDTFDGFRCEINKQVSPFMAAIHSFHLGTSMIPDGRKSSYSFLTQVADESGIVMARVDPGRGSIDGRIHQAVLGGIAMGKVQIGVSTEGQGDQMVAELDVGGRTWTGNVKYGSMGGGGVYGVNFMQTVHPNVAMGGEGMYIAANQNLLSSYTAKFNWQARVDGLENNTTSPTPPSPGMPPPEASGHSVLCCNYNSGQGAATLNYKRCVTPNRLTLGAELQFSPMSLDSQVLMGAEFKWQRSKLNVCVDGGGRIQSVLEAKYGMEPGSPTLMFSADMDHLKDEMRFGYGINIES